MKKIGLSILGILIAAVVLGAVDKISQLQLLDQREAEHYKSVLELKGDIKGIKKYLLTGEKKYLIENDK